MADRLLIMPELPELLKVGEIAEKLRVSRMTVYRLVTDGTLPAVRVGQRTIRVRRSDFMRYLGVTRATAEDVAEPRADP